MLTGEGNFHVFGAVLFEAFHTESDILDIEVPYAPVDHTYPAHGPIGGDLVAAKSLAGHVFHGAAARGIEKASQKLGDGPNQFLQGLSE